LWSIFFLRIHESDFELANPLTSKLQNANEQLTSNKENIKLQNANEQLTSNKETSNYKKTRNIAEIKTLSYNMSEEQGNAEGDNGASAAH
jgi:hypothetical protein